MAEIVRKELGAYMSAECFRYLRQGAEDTAGRALIVAAGKQRGHSLNDMLNGIAAEDGSAIATRLNQLLGKEGTRLCIVDEVAPTQTGYRVSVRESACSTGIQTPEPNCAFTMGVFLGALEVVSNHHFTIHESECVACGSQHCVYELEAI